MNTVYYNIFEEINRNLKGYLEHNFKFRKTELL